MLNARITFGNIFASDAPAPGVTYIEANGDTPMCCVVDESCFDAPNTYSVLGGCKTNLFFNLMQNEALNPWCKDLVS